MTKYWMAVASREHVLRGLKGGFCQVCHGKPGPLKLMSEDDWIIYYSPTEKFGVKIPYQKFTAIGQMKHTPPYLFKMSEDFIPWRRDVQFYSAKEVSILSLIDKLSFIQNKSRWGFPFRRGCFSIDYKDFTAIASLMGIAHESI